MNWPELSPKDFLEWLSIEGLDGAEKIRHEYDQLPWRLRIAFWAFTHTGDEVEWINHLYPNTSFDQDENFRRHMCLSFFGCKDDSIEDTATKSNSWLNSLDDRLPFGDEEPPEKLVAMIKGQIPGPKIQQDFDLFTPWRQELQPEKIPDNPPDSFWDAFWPTYFEHEDLEWFISEAARKNIPVKYLDKWRANPHPNKPSLSANSYILAATIGHLKIVPPHWVEEITRLEKIRDYKHLEILSNYLSRQDVPKSFREKYLSHEDTFVRAAALKHGSYTKEFLEGLPIHQSGWDAMVHQLVNRPDMDLSFASVLLKKCPLYTELWAKRLDLPKDVRLLVAQNGYTVNWVETDADVLSECLKSGSHHVWQDLATHATKKWPKSILESLARAIIPLSETSSWAVRRLLNLGNIQTDKDLVRIMMTSKSRSVRLLAANNLSSLSKPTKIRL